MAKITKISEIEPSLSFTEFDFYQYFSESFKTSELGKLKSVLPLSALASTFRKSSSKKTSAAGRKNYFSLEGKIALMFLKSYTNLSDSDLLTQLNSNIHYQLFCDVRIHPQDPLKNFKIISEIRCELAQHLNIPKLQQVLATSWKPYMSNLHICMSDATCYESSVRYPTDRKLLWECCQWQHDWILKISKENKLRRPRNKYKKTQQSYLSYSKNRNRKKSKSKKITRSLLHLCNKLSHQLSDLLSTNHINTTCITRLPDFKKRRSIIKKILLQQQEIFETSKTVPDRIVSLDKHYLRPIVRGKETKQVEFGAKSNNIQIDGISFIQHISFNAFHEGLLTPDCIMLQQSLFGKRVLQFAGDKAYSTNANRKYCKQRGIATSFVRKGKAGPNEDQYKQLRSILGKERATRLEGSFGVQKQFYSLQKIKARTKETELLWIFFGIHTSNAVMMIEKSEKYQQENQISPIAI